MLYVLRSRKFAAPPNSLSLSVVSVCYAKTRILRTLLGLRYCVRACILSITSVHGAEEQVGRLEFASVLLMGLFFCWASLY